MSVNALLQHADIWRGRDTPPVVRGGVSTGFDALDDLFPGQGWPVGAITEIQVAHAGLGALSLVMPAMAHLSQTTERWVAMIAPPYVPYAPALVEHGMDPSHILWVHPRKNSDGLWALEQALRSGTCSMVLGWVPGITAKALRRLQLAAEEGHCCGFLFLSPEAANRSSPAALRLRLEVEQGTCNVHILKRRGGWASGPVALSFG